MTENIAEHETAIKTIRQGAKLKASQFFAQTDADIAQSLFMIHIGFLDAAAQYGFVYPRKWSRLGSFRIGKDSRNKALFAEDSFQENGYRLRIYKTGNDLTAIVAHDAAHFLPKTIVREHQETGAELFRDLLVRNNLDVESDLSAMIYKLSMIPDIHIRQETINKCSDLLRFGLMTRTGFNNAVSDLRRRERHEKYALAGYYGDEAREEAKLDPTPWYGNPATAPSAHAWTFKHIKEILFG